MVCVSTVTSGPPRSVLAPHPRRCLLFMKSCAETVSRLLQVCLCLRHVGPEFPFSNYLQSVLG